MFSQKSRLYFDKAKKFGHIKNPTHTFTVGDYQNGHYFTIELKIVDDLVEDLGYVCPRCLPAIACGSWLEEKLLGNHLMGTSLNLEDLIQDLDGLPPQRCFYAWMAIEAVRRALLEVKE